MLRNISRTKICLVLLLVLVIGVLGDRYISREKQEKISGVVSKMSASLANHRDFHPSRRLLISRKVSREHYTVDACIVWCFDDRFSSLYDEFVRISRYKRVDRVNLAGGGKDSLSPDGYVVGQIKKSCAIHHAKEVVIMVHISCGAYGEIEDQLFYENELRLIKLVVTELLKGIEHPPKIRVILAEFDGLYELDV